MFDSIFTNKQYTPSIFGWDLKKQWSMLKAAKTAETHGCIAMPATKAEPPAPQISPEVTIVHRDETARINADAINDLRAIVGRLTGHDHSSTHGLDLTLILGHRLEKLLPPPSNSNPNQHNCPSCVN